MALAICCRSSAYATAGETVDGEVGFRRKDGDFVCACPPHTVVGQAELPLKYSIL
jgi:hypothetical protein